ncbi:MAG: hypothetical protein MUO68_00005 [Desulfobacteraceae bacterium]|nr:hypothetical protein [Desulfobacteraceae bacterium]
MFDIVEAKANSGEEISISLTEEKEPDGKAYVLTVENRRKTQGRYSDTITLLTTSSIRKKLTIPVYGDIKARQIAVITPPGSVMLRGYAGEAIKASVTIVPKKERMFDIVETKADKGENIRFTLTTSKEADSNVYLLTVENIKKTQGRFRDNIRLFTTDKIQKEITIPIWGEIKAPEIASIKPRRLTLTGSAREPVKGSVNIIPNDKYPFSITEVKPRDGKNIKYDLKVVEESGKKIYILTVENLKKEKGGYYDTINLKTDSKDLPEIRISVSARISD